MALDASSRLGPYEIVAPLGAGGMGEVYRARDTKLNREVALKVLPDAFTRDPERLARFKREAQVLASLNHPHIGAIYGFEDSGDTHALVLELVEGETLATRTSRGPLALDEAMAVARAIADALDAAHEKGIVHRDLKPANVMVTPEATVKVLDFGLATIDDRLRSDLSRSPTMTDLGTREGVVLGTAAYMSPEQARGQAVDKRADIWAFGCVLFEMLSGQPAFAGATRSDTLAKVLEREPEWTRIPASTPRSVRRLMERCLTKDAKRRVRDIGDARAELDDITEPLQAHASAFISPPRWRTYAAWVAAGVLAILLVAVLVREWRRDNPPAGRVVRTRIDLPANQRLATLERAHPLALSPDGARLAYVGDVDGRVELYVRELSELEPRRLPGTVGARQPFFSPNGEWIGFFTAGALHKIAVEGGPPFRICNLPASSVGGSWSPDDTIVFATFGSALAKVPAAGGTPMPIPGSDGALWPQILPDSRMILFTLDWKAMAVVPMAGGEPRIVARTTDAAVEGPSVLGAGDIQATRVLRNGHIVYGQDPGIVRVASLDPMSMTLTDSPVSLAENVERGPGGGAVVFAVSDTGLMVYASTGTRHQLVWVDRTGVATPITSDRDAFRIPRLSPDGKHLVIAINDETRRSDLWVYDVERRIKTRLTTEGHNLGAVWRPDGAALTFSGGDVRDNRIVELVLDGSRKEMLLRGPTPLAEYPSSWSPDGRELLFTITERSGPDLWVLPRADATAARPLLARPFNDSGGQFSPDGRWLTFVSDESGRPEIYAASYPGLGSRVTISTESGRHPRWSRDGRELFYKQGDALMAVTIDTSSGFRASAPRRLFAGPYWGASQDDGFDVAPDGQRFVMVKSDEAATLRYLTLVQGWMEDLRSRVPSNR